MSMLIKPLGYLTAFAASVGGAGCGLEVSAQASAIAAAAQDEHPVQLPRPPLKIPLPLDKAGYKVDVTFEVPPLLLLKDMEYLNYLIGLRVMFAPGTSDVRIALEEHPVTVRMSLHRIEDGREVNIPLFDSRMISGADEFPRRFDVFEIPEGKALAKLAYAEHSGAPRGTPDASALVLDFAGPKKAVTPGRYRFQVETLEDIPELGGITSFFVYEEPLNR